jgi:Fe2+ transport system protein FeoA/ABC-type nickel/cobalt efflux system permease component RcnA
MLLPPLNMVRQTTKARVSIARPNLIVRARNFRTRTKRRLKEFGIDANASLRDIQDALLSDFRDLTTSIVVVLTVGFVWCNSTADGFLWNWLLKHNNNFAAAWILKHPHRFLGMVAFAPTIISAPRRVATFVGIAVISCIWVGPLITIWDYGVLAILVHLILRTKLPSTRIMLATIIIVMYYVGYFAETDQQDTFPGWQSSARHSAARMPRDLHPTHEHEQQHHAATHEHPHTTATQPTHTTTPTNPTTHTVAQKTTPPHGA